MIRLSVAQPIAPALETIVEPLRRREVPATLMRKVSQIELGTTPGRDSRSCTIEQPWATTYLDQPGDLPPFGKQLTFWSYPSIIHPISELCHANSVA